MVKTVRQDCIIFHPCVGLGVWSAAGAQLDVTPTVSYALHAPRMPSYALERGASTRTVTQGESLRERAVRILGVPRPILLHDDVLHCRHEPTRGGAKRHAPIWGGRESHGEPGDPQPP